MPGKGPLPAAFWCCDTICGHIECSCTFSGVVSGYDITLTWTTTGEDTGTVKIIDSLGNETSVADDGSLLVEDGTCRTYTLTFECSGVTISVPCTVTNTDPNPTPLTGCQCMEGGVVSVQPTIQIDISGTPTFVDYHPDCADNLNPDPCVDLSGSYVVTCEGDSNALKRESRVTHCRAPHPTTGVLGYYIEQICLLIFHSGGSATLSISFTLDFSATSESSDTIYTGLAATACPLGVTRKEWEYYLTGSTVTTDCAGNSTFTCGTGVTLNFSGGDDITSYGCKFTGLSTSASLP